MKNVFVIIPSLNPEKELFVPFINDLKKQFGYIIVIDDGSVKSTKELFDEVEDKNVIVLKHFINYGKGRAIKTALNYILNTYDKIDAIVTADCDGQHAVSDIKACAEASIKHQRSYVLGVRDFKASNVPFKSRFGNLLTRNIMRFFVGLNITDTQTGLRAMSKEVAVKLLLAKGERYEYETNTLIMCKELNIPLKEVKIDTIYLDDNKRSHFNPLKDGLRIYKLFVKYIIGSLSSFVLDILLFALFFSIITNVNGAFIATVLARIISSLYNYLINAKLVFKSLSKSSLIKYIILVIVQMLVSALTVNYLNKILLINTLVIKIIVDIIIFMVNFVVQREFIFKK